MGVNFSQTQVVEDAGEASVVLDEFFSSGLFEDFVGCNFIDAGGCVYAEHGACEEDSFEVFDSYGFDFCDDSVGAFAYRWFVFELELGAYEGYMDEGHY